MRDDESLSRQKVGGNGVEDYGMRLASPVDEVFATNNIQGVNC